MSERLVTINSRRFDGSLKRSWNCKYIGRNASLLTFVGEFDRDVEHGDLGLIRQGTVSYEYYWLDRWYNVFRFCEPDGNLRNYYCNINMPPLFEGSVLDYVDLDIDIVVWPDGRVVILDEDEYKENAAALSYPEDIHIGVGSAISELKDLIARRGLPEQS